MAYAVFEEGEIKHYPVLPKSYHSKHSNVLGGFQLLPREELAKHGFFPVKEYPYNKELRYKKNLYWDENGKVFRWNIVDREGIGDLPKHKEELKKQVKQHIIGKLRETDHIVIESLEFGEEIPTEVKTERARIRARKTEIELEIENISDTLQIKKYQIKI